MSEFLIKNANIAIDEKKLYLNASLHIKDNRVYDIYHNHRDLDIKTIDLKGKYIIPAFFTIDKQRGSANYLAKEKDDQAIGRYIDIRSADLKDVKLAFVNENSDIDYLLSNNINIVYGQSFISKDRLKELNIKAVGPLYYNMPMYNPYHPNIVNYAFEDNPYVFVDLKDMQSDSVKFLLKTINRDKLIFIGNHLIDDLKIGADILDLVAYTSSNMYKLLDIDKCIGRLYKGSSADFIVLDDKFNYLFGVIKGEVCH